MVLVQDSSVTFGSGEAPIVEDKKFPYWMLGLLAIPLLLIKKK